MEKLKKIHSAWFLFFSLAFRTTNHLSAYNKRVKNNIRTWSNRRRYALNLNKNEFEFSFRGQITAVALDGGTSALDSHGEPADDVVGAGSITLKWKLICTDWC